MGDLGAAAAAEGGKRLTLAALRWADGAPGGGDNDLEGGPWRPVQAGHSP